MKVYRNSTYIFLAMSIASLLLSAYFSTNASWNFYCNICLGVFGSSLISLFSSLIFYFYEKEKIIISLGIKCVSLYGLLNRFIKDIPEQKDIVEGKISILGLVKYYDNYTKSIKENSIRSYLVNYSGLLSSSFFCKIHYNDEIKLISSLWTMEENLINKFPEAIYLLDKTQNEYELAKLEQNKSQQKIKEFEILDILNRLKTNTPLQIEFIDQMLCKLFKYKNFNSTWDELKLKMKAN